MLYKEVNRTNKIRLKAINISLQELTIFPTLSIGRSKKSIDENMIVDNCIANFLSGEPFLTLYYFLLVEVH